MVKKHLLQATSPNGFKTDFATILHEHQSMVFSIGYHFTQNASVAEELAQDAFLQLYRNLASIKSAAHLKSWLRKTTVHRCLDYGRRQRSASWVPLDSIPEPASDPQLPDCSLAESVTRLLCSLPEKARLMVILRFQEELQPNEIAELLDMPVNTVKSRLHRALALLRRKLEGVHGGVRL